MRSLHSSPPSARRLGRARHDGMTLIEVLVTLVIMSVGLLGVAALQLTTVRNNYDAFVRSQAAMLASDMLDRMRANRLQAQGYVAVFNGDTNPATGTTAANDVAQWRQTLAAQLPLGVGQIDFNAATQVVTIRIQWGERNAVVAQRTLEFRTSSQI